MMRGKVYYTAVHNSARLTLTPNHKIHPLSLGIVENIYAICVMCHTILNISPHACKHNVCSIGYAFFPFKSLYTTKGLFFHRNSYNVCSTTIYVTNMYNKFETLPAV